MKDKLIRCRGVLWIVTVLLFISATFIQIDQGRTQKFWMLVGTAAVTGTLYYIADRWNDQGGGD